METTDKDTGNGYHDTTALPTFNDHRIIEGHYNRLTGSTISVDSRTRWPWRPAGRPAGEPPDRAQRWLRVAMFALAALAIAAAIVSWQAQYTMVYNFKHNAAIAALQATIPDSAALVFAALGVALALRGRQAFRARVLNVTCVGISIAMNAFASTTGWTALAIWVMAPVMYALASDTLITVIRTVQAGDETSGMGRVVGLTALWTLRAVVAPRSTATGTRRMILNATPIPALSEQPAIEPPATPPTKKARLIALYKTHPDYGNRSVAARVAAELAPAADLQAGTARSYLGMHLTEIGR